MTTKIVLSEKGFTLLEILIVVALLGIIMTIAIPQFKSYRIKGYDSASLTDLRNLVMTEEMFFTEWSVFASTANGGLAGRGDLLGVGSHKDIIFKGSLSGYPESDADIRFFVTSGVYVQVNSNNPDSQTFLCGAQHQLGKKIFVFDFDQYIAYF